MSGAPCPAFSAAGLKKALADQRGAVILHSLEYVVAKRPRIAILENVRGLSQGDNKCIMQKIIEILKTANYSVRAEIVDTAEHGLPHSRNRLYIAAWQSVDGLFLFFNISNSRFTQRRQQNQSRLQYTGNASWKSSTFRSQWLCRTSSSLW